MTRCGVVLCTTIAMLVSACSTAGARRQNDALRARLTAADSAARAAVRDEQRLEVATIDQSVVGVTPFAVTDSDTTLIALGYALSDLLLGDLATVRRLSVVDRLRLDALLRELVLVQRSTVDTTRAPRVGRLLGAGRLVVGALERVPTGKRDEFALALRIVDSRSGRASGTLDARAPMRRILDAEKAVAFRVLDALNVQPTPEERERISARQTGSLRALVAYGRGVQASARGDIDVARNAFADAIDADPGFAVARTRLNQLPGGSSDRSVQGAMSAAGERVNAAAPTRVAEAADGALSSAREIVRLLITVRLP